MKVMRVFIEYSINLSRKQYVVDAYYCPFSQNYDPLMITGFEQTTEQLCRLLEYCAEGLSIGLEYTIQLL